MAPAAETFSEILAWREGYPGNRSLRRAQAPKGLAPFDQAKPQPMDEPTDTRALPRAAQVHRSLQLEAAAAGTAGLVPEWLFEFEKRTEAKDVDRIAADRDLLYRLQVAAFAGPEWDYFADIIVRYGFPVMYAWIRTGVVVEKCRQHGIERGLPPGKFAGRIQHADADDLAIQTVAEAVSYFRDVVLMRNKWRPDGGASLKTYFIGQALWRYPVVNARWRRELDRSPWLVTDPIVLPDARPRSEPEDLVVDRMMLPVAAEGVDAKTLKVVAMDVMGYSHAEIAAELGAGATAKTVENLLYRHKVRQKKLRQQKGA